jgi:hypothetical protein
VQFQNTTAGQQAFVSVGTPDGNSVGAVNQALYGANSQINGLVGSTFGDPNSIQAFTACAKIPSSSTWRSLTALLVAPRTFSAGSLPLLLARCDAVLFARTEPAE